MKWITREKPIIDRITPPWLIRRFNDKEAEFLNVPTDQVMVKSMKFGAIPFDISEVELSHEGDFCRFDAFLKKYNHNDEALKHLATI